MKRVDYLIREAKDAIQFRGHVMRKFKRTTIGAVYDCPACGAGIAVIAKPMPNQIDICGEALAVHCVGSQLAMYRKTG